MPSGFSSFPPRQTEQVGETVYHLDVSGQRLGTLGMPGGLATHLFDASHFQLDDSYCIAHQNFWKAETPFINNVADVRRMFVPDKTYYEGAGYGAHFRQIIDAAGGRIGLIGDCDSATLAFNLASGVLNRP